MIYTSCFRVAGRERNAVSIARGSPIWFRGRRFEPLTPSREMLALSPFKFVEAYALQLARLDPKVIARELVGRILCCWERAGVKLDPLVCHRHQVASWFLEAGIDVQEFNRRDLQLRLFRDANF